MTGASQPLGVPGWWPTHEPDEYDDHTLCHRCTLEREAGLSERVERVLRLADEWDSGRDAPFGFVDVRQRQACAATLRAAIYPSANAPSGGAT